MRHVIENNLNKFYKTTKDNKPVISVSSGDELEFETIDCFSKEFDADTDIFNFQMTDRRIPATGPVYIKTAKPGDVIKIEIISIECDGIGFMVFRPLIGPIGHIIKKKQLKKLIIRNNMVELGFASLPIQPMIGYISVAPESGEYSNRIPGYYGGNMDVKEVTVSSIVYLPIFVDGALLSFGDVHALMAEGEVSGTGIEISARIVVKISVLKGKYNKGMVVDNAEKIIFIGIGKGFKCAIRNAIQNAYMFLSESTNAEKSDILCFLGCFGNLGISQVVNPFITSTVTVSKNILNYFIKGKGING
ncbi:MAG: acetamidase/formamidase family protein [Actinomycetota bacterium]|nr:acetamidase/formamidase family protein [Actinomycetota bacterium]